MTLTLDALFHRPSKTLATFGLWLLLAVVATTVFAAAPAGSAETHATFLGATAADLDLELPIRWGSAMDGATMVHLDLIDAEGLSVASQWLYPTPDQTTVVTLPQVFEDATSRDQHLLARLQDAEGLELATPYPMQTRLQCVADEPCEYRVDGGVSAPSMLHLRPQMAAALAEAEASGADSLLTFVADQFPELAGDVHSTAWQLKVIQEQSGSTSSCECLWTVVTEEEDTDCGGTCGSTHMLYVSRVGNEYPTAGKSLSGNSRMTVDLACWDITNSGNQEVELAGGTTVDVDTMDILPCAAECGGSVAFEGTYSVDQVGITGTSGDSVVVQDEVTFSVDSSQIFHHQYSLSTGAGLDDFSTSNVQQSAAASPGATARISSGATVAVHYTPFLPPFAAPRTLAGPRSASSEGSIGPTPSAEGWAYGLSNSTYQLTADVESPCTGSLSYLAYTLSNASPVDKSGGGDDITILVGKCDG